MKCATKAHMVIDLAMLTKCREFKYVQLLGGPCQTIEARWLKEETVVEIVTRACEEAKMAGALLERDALKFQKCSDFKNHWKFKICSELRKITNIHNI